MWRIRGAADEDVADITRLTNAFVGQETIEWTETPHSEEARLAWMRQRAERGFPVLVAERPGAGVIGFASYGDFRDSLLRPGYAVTVEHTVHVDQAAWGCGVGRALMEALFARARQDGKHVMIAGITSENRASLVFHHKLGFVETGRLLEVGFMFGGYLDLVLLQKRLSAR